jgi:hypothetical protein
VLTGRCLITAFPYFTKKYSYMKKAYLHLSFVFIFLTTITGSLFSQAQTDSSKENLEIVFTKAEVKPTRHSIIILPNTSILQMPVTMRKGW